MLRYPINEQEEPMIIFIATLGVIAAIGGASSIRTVAKDGFGRVPTRII